ncbi:hypothetical protein, partial [Thermococcus sp.]|uniref:hypothetical protein n=1 Tax=Thermococcus sp. TaxID=35749 RepID=UPI00261A41B1
RDMGFTIEGNKVIIEFNPNSTQLSKSGKTYMLASSGGFVWVEDGNGGMIGVSYNIVRKRE